MISVVIVDDHPLIRAGLKAAIDLAEDIQVVAEGCSGAEALRAVALRNPDVLVLDVNLPDMHGAEIVKQIRSSNTSTAILILTVEDDQTTILNLLKNGANGYALKDESGELIIHAIRSTSKGETWLSPRVAKKVVNRAVHTEDQTNRLHSDRDKPTLSVRELQILRLIAEGLTNEEIANRLFLTPRTIQNHVSLIYSKIGVNSRTAAALYAIRNKMIDL